MAAAREAARNTRAEPEPVEVGEGGEDPLHASMKVLADGKRKPTEQEVGDALAWFLDDEEPVFRRTLKLNVGTDEEPKWILWTFRALSGEEISRIQRESQGNRAARRAGQERDPDEVIRRTVAMATVEPDLAEAARLKGVEGSVADPLYGPMQVLRWRFRAKSGLLTQLSGEIMQLSGYDEDDLQSAVQAGKD